MKPPLRVSVTVFPESDPSACFGVFDTLWAAGKFCNEQCDVPPMSVVFEPQLIGPRPGPLRLISGVTIETQAPPTDQEAPDIVFVPDVRAIDSHSLRGLDRELLAWIRRMYAGGAHLYSSSGGSLVFAEAGLLAGLETTTRWGYAHLFAREYPDVRLRLERLFVQTGRDGRIVCGGASSWQELILLLVTQHAGAEDAARVAKIFHHEWHIDGQSASAYLVQQATHDDPVVRAQQAWFAQHYRRPDLLREAVRRSGLSERSLGRRFKAATGSTPIAYIQALRIEQAKQLLERTKHPVEDIGCAVGYRDPVSFRRLFKRLSGITPATYRRKYAPPPRSLSNDAD